jgi:hypothetical protein
MTVGGGWSCPHSEPVVSAHYVNRTAAFSHARLPARAMSNTLSERGAAFSDRFRSGLHILPTVDNIAALLPILQPGNEETAFLEESATRDNTVYAIKLEHPICGETHVSTRPVVPQDSG